MRKVSAPERLTRASLSMLQLLVIGEVRTVESVEADPSGSRFEVSSISSFAGSSGVHVRIVEALR
jgi:hypothetical protein